MFDIRSYVKNYLIKTKYFTYTIILYRRMILCMNRRKSKVTTLHKLMFPVFLLSSDKWKEIKASFCALLWVVTIPREVKNLIWLTFIFGTNKNTLQHEINGYNRECYIRFPSNNPIENFHHWSKVTKSFPLFSCFFFILVT